MSVAYTVTTPSPGTHRLHVRAELPAGCADLVFPSWTPGSYLMREFARNVRGVHAYGPDGAPVAIERVSRNTWRAATDGPYVLEYQVYAREKSVRTPYLDDELMFWLPSNVLVHPPAARDAGFSVSVAVPAGHVAVNPLGDAVRAGDSPAVATWSCADVDALYDSFVAVGPFEHAAFDVDGVPHHHWIEPGHDGDVGRMAADFERVVREAARLMGGGLPYPRYDMVTLLAAKGHGGLEHKDGCVLLRPRASFAAPKEYEEFVTLAAHEHFHAWNVKRIHPDTLGPRFDYANEHYTRDLWWLEGGTVYYEERIAFRAGTISRPRHLERLADLVNRYLRAAGRHWQSLEESSFDTWIKLYRPSEDSANSTISYYLKGAVVILAMDLEILARTHGARGADDVLRALWERWGRHGVGYPERRGLRDVAREVVGGGGEWERWWDAHVVGTDRVAIEAALDRAGFDLVFPAPRPGSVLGVEIGERMLVESVREDGPSAACLSVQDELLAIDGHRVATPAALGAQLERRPPGSEVTLLVSRDARVRAVRAVTASPSVGDARIVERTGVDAARLAVRAAWLGTSGGA